jgi:hypothetical protein
MLEVLLQPTVHGNEEISVLSKKFTALRSIDDDEFFKTVPRYCIILMEFYNHLPCHTEHSVEINDPLCLN